jgi:signal peptidase II
LGENPERSGIGAGSRLPLLSAYRIRTRPQPQYCYDIFRLEYALNPGGFLSLGANIVPGLRFWIFTVLNVVLLAVVLFVLAVKWDMHLAKFVALVLLVAGGFGNLIDRALHSGFVTDFANLGVGPVRTGIFNVADVAITAGALILFWGLVVRRRPERSTPTESRAPGVVPTGDPRGGQALLRNLGERPTLPATNSIRSSCYRS